MNHKQVSFWNQLYSSARYLFGEESNAFLSMHLKDLPVGKILFPAEGEGRNAVYAAQLGWEVSAFDWSEVAQKKAYQLAQLKKVSIAYQVASVEKLSYALEEFDMLALLYAHFSFEDRKRFHRQLISYLKKGGLVLLEGFAREGDVKDIKYTIDELSEDFVNLEILTIEKKETHLNEGIILQGKQNIIRMLARKPNN